MEFQPPSRVSPLLSDRTGFEACKIAGYHNDHDYASMGIPDLVPLSSGNVHRPTLTTETLVGSSKEPQGRVPPSNQEWHDEAGSLASVRKRMFTKKISDTATNLIARAKSRGTRSNYDSAWRKFTGWCSGREINPFSCPLGDVLDYLGHMFEKQYKYRTINNHRSAISAYHRPIDGMKVGSHPYVTDLMKGVNNERPPLPKYRFIWDVELVLGKMKELPGNQDLPLDLLSHKLVTLLGLCAVQRGSEIHALNLKWISKSSEGYKCAFGCKVKHSRNGKVAPPVDFYPFPQDLKLCPVDCLDAYIKLTQPFRESAGNALFLSTKKPHNPVVKSTLTKWVLKMLSLGGVDTKKFQTHSLRSSSTSKIAAGGFSVKDILTMGNWSSESVWQKFYHKRVISTGERFQNALLSG